MEKKNKPNVAGLILLTCEGSGKKAAWDGEEAWRLVSLDGSRSLASELCVYLTGQRGKDATTCMPHRGQLAENM